MGQEGVWWGIVAGDVLGRIVALIWTGLYLRAILRVERRDGSGSL